MALRADTLPRRLWSKVDRSNPNDCWLWRGAHDRHGYGWVGNPDGSNHAHRIAWELVNGPIPAGLELDHLCRTPACVNPSHLEPVTHKENMQRAAAVRTHCRYGHPLDGLTVLRDGRQWRRCNRCHRERERAAYHVRKVPA